MRNMHKYIIIKMRNVFLTSICAVRNQIRNKNILCIKVFI